jgi:putative ABC transport system permease protein
MYKVYWKQAIEMLKQNKFISIISIVGTALAIMMIMTLIVVDEVKNISIAPENNRDRTLYITYQVKREVVGKNSFNTQSGDVTTDVFNDYILPNLKTPEYISMMSDFDPEFRQTVNVEGESNYFQFPRRIVDASYWNVFSFDFIDGNPFSEEDFQSGVHNVVLSESVARELFKGERAVGRTIQINFENHRVTGVVKDVPHVFRYAAGDIWVSGKSYGSVLLVARNKQDFSTIAAEVREAERKFGIENDPWFLYLRGPENQRINSMDISWANNEEEFKNAIKVANRRRVFLFTILLIIPALNLSGFSLSRIKKRTSEIGVRKAFGAKKHTILIQVLYENLITSLIGGIIGLILSYIAVVWFKNWLLGVTDGSTIPLNTFLSPAIFVIVFAVCVLLNLLSAGLSALKASRMSIVNSLNKNDQL